MRRIVLARSSGLMESVGAILLRAECEGWATTIPAWWTSHQSSSRGDLRACTPQPLRGVSLTCFGCPARCRRSRCTLSTHIGIVGGVWHNSTGLVEGEGDNITSGTNREFGRDTTVWRGDWRYPFTDTPCFGLSLAGQNKDGREGREEREHAWRDSRR